MSVPLPRWIDAVGIPRSLYESAEAKTLQLANRLDAEVFAGHPDLRRRLDSAVQTLRDELHLAYHFPTHVGWMVMLWEARAAGIRMPDRTEDPAQWLQTTFLPAYWAARGGVPRAP